MGLYEGIKDAIGIAQKADNIELYRQLLDLGAQALEMQAEIARLTAENEELRKTRDVESDIEYHVDAFVTKKSDEKPIKYCSTCWGDKKKMIVLQVYRGGHYLYCPLCNAKVYLVERHGNQITY